MFDSELAKKFEKYLSETSLEELEKRANQAPCSGMCSILNEHIQSLKYTKGAGIGIDLSILSHTPVDYHEMDKETLQILRQRLSEMKPLDPEFQRILNENILELF